MTDIFLSYARTNRDRVSEIANGFANGGYDLWWDTALRAGDNYAIKIEKALDATKSVVVCWSQQAKESLWVRAEATEALDNGKLIQLKLDESRMPLPFNVLNMIPFDGWSGDTSAPEWAQLEQEVGEKTGRHVKASASNGATLTREAPAELGQRLQGLGPVAVTGFALLILTLGVAILTLLLGEGLIEFGMYRTLTLSGFGTACLGAILVFWRFGRTAIATRRS